MAAIYVYPEIEVIFLHLPKCAGKTVQKHLSKITRKKEQYHAHIPDKYSAYWKFAVCRNPFDRFISAWRYCVERGWVSDCTPLQFLDIVKSLAKSGRYAIASKNHEIFLQDKNYLCLHHSAPMTHPDRLITDDVNVFRFEDLEQLIFSLEGWYEVELPPVHLNQTQHERYQVYYDSALYHQVLDYYSEDFDAFGYPRSLPLI